MPAALPVAEVPVMPEDTPFALPTLPVLSMLPGLTVSVPLRLVAGVPGAVGGPAERPGATTLLLAGLPEGLAAAGLPDGPVAALLGELAAGPVAELGAAAGVALVPEPVAAFVVDGLAFCVRFGVWATLRPLANAAAHSAPVSQVVFIAISDLLARKRGHSRRLGVALCVPAPSSGSRAGKLGKICNRYNFTAATTTGSSMRRERLPHSRSLAWKLPPGTCQSFEWRVTMHTPLARARSAAWILALALGAGLAGCDRQDISRDTAPTTATPDVPASSSGNPLIGDRPGGTERPTAAVPGTDAGVAQPAGAASPSTMSGVAPSPSADRSQPALDNDTVARQVRQAILSTPALAGYDEVRVTAQDGEITLSGNMRSQADIDKAMETAQGVQGVKRVRNALKSGG
jgi:hyperosmotically inducible protein